MVNISKQIKKKFYNSLGFRTRKDFLKFIRAKKLSGRRVNTVQELKIDIINEVVDSKKSTHFTNLKNAQKFKLTKNKDIKKYDISEKSIKAFGQYKRFNIDLVDKKPPQTIRKFYDNVKFYKNLIGAIGQEGRAYGRFKFEPQGGGAPEWRQLKITSFDNFVQSYNDVINKVEGTEGSDVIAQGYKLRNDFFVLSKLNYAFAGGGKYKTIDKKIKSKIYMVKNYQSTENNCLIACVKGYLNDKNIKTEKLRTVRNKLNEKYNIEKGVFMTTEDIPKVEEYYSVTINVFSDDKVNDFIYKSKKKTKHNINILLVDEHYVIIKSVQKTKKRIVKKFKYLFYDIETVYDNKDDNFLHPYSISFFEIDPETRKDFIFTEKDYENAKCYTLLDTDKPVEEFIKYVKRSRDNYIIIGFNNSRFDNFFLVDEANRKGILDSVMYVNNSLLKMEIKGSKVIDLCRFLNQSLKKCCDNYKTNPKKIDGFSHDEVQKAYELDKTNNNSLKKWIEDNNEKLIKYNKYDVLSLCSLYYKVAKCSKDVLKKDLHEFVTISQACYSRLKDIWKSNKFDVKPPKNINDDGFCRRAMFGGRTQCYYYGMYKGIFKMIDVKSLYPFVMMCENSLFPIGQYKETKEYINGKLGIYNCVIKSQNIEWDEHMKKYFKTEEGRKYYKEYAPCIIPKRSLKKGDSLDWFYRGEQECVLNSVDIEQLKKYNCEIVVEDGIYWDNSTNQLFKDYLFPLMNLKNKHDKYKDEGNKKYNPSERSFSKLCSNGVSGKVGQNNFDDVFHFVKSPRELKKFFNKVNLDTLDFRCGSNSSFFTAKLKNEEDIYINPKPSFLAGFIYSYARKYMYDTILYKYCTLYQDTDSALLPIGEYKRFVKENENIYNTGVYGCLEEELLYDTDKVYLLQPKCYCAIMKNEDEPNKYRFKGINGSNSYITESNYNKLNNKSIDEIDGNEKRELYEKLENKCLTPKMYEDLNSGERLYIFQSQLKKSKESNGELRFGVCQKFLIKKICLKKSKKIYKKNIAKKNKKINIDKNQVPQLLKLSEICGKNANSQQLIFKILISKSIKTLKKT